MRRGYDLAAIMITETYACLEARVGNYEARRHYSMTYGPGAKYDPTMTYDQLEHEPFPEGTSYKMAQEKIADLYSLLRAQRKYRK